MRVLITNDGGVASEGLWALARRVIEAGYEGGKDWLKRNGGTFEDMLAFIERGINGVDEDLPW